MPNTRQYAKALREAVPANMRTYIETLLGNREPITERDLSRSDREALQYAVQDAQARRMVDLNDLDMAQAAPVNQGAADQAAILKARTPLLDPQNDSFSYENYPPSDTLEDGWMGDIVNSFSDPSYRMQTTVGQGRYGTDAEGNTLVSDTYDWNAGKDARNLSKADKAALFAQALRGGPLQVGNLVGNLLAPDDAPNVRQTRINLGASR